MAQQPPGTENFTKILNWGLWVVMALAVIGVIITAGAMVVSHNQGRGSDHMGRLGFVFGGMLLAAGAAGIVNAVL